MNDHDTNSNGVHTCSTSAVRFHDVISAPAGALYPVSEPPAGGAYGAPGEAAFGTAGVPMASQAPYNVMTL